MIHETGNRLLDRLEIRFGGLALPKALRWVAGFQLLTWLLSLFSPDFLEWIAYDRQAILSGQVWRLFTWAVFPAAANPLFVLFALFFLFFINDGLESEWGSFRLNVYVFATIASISLAGLLPFTDGAAAIFNGVFYSAVFLAFATLYPEQLIHLFGIIPVKAKWLGWLDAAMLAALVVTSSPRLIVAGLVFAGLIPYFLTFAPAYLQNRRTETAAKVRRHRFESSAASPAESFHECEACGATEKTHPERDFRVAGDGSEYCDACRKPA